MGKSGETAFQQCGSKSKGSPVGGAVQQMWLEQSQGWGHTGQAVKDVHGETKLREYFTFLYGQGLLSKEH